MQTNQNQNSFHFLSFLAKSLLASLTMISLSTKAAPIPTTSSSILASAESGLFFRGLGFSMNTKGTNWVALHDDESFLLKSARLGPKGSAKQVDAPRLTVRVDSLSKSATLETYAKKWMRDYGNFGFETLGSQTIQIGGGKALVVDLVQKSKNKQLRQVILNKDSRVAILTCIDQKTNFNSTLPLCNQIIKSFEWNPVDDLVTAKLPTPPSEAITK